LENSDEFYEQAGEFGIEKPLCNGYSIFFSGLLQVNMANLMKNIRFFESFYLVVSMTKTV